MFARFDDHMDGRTDNGDFEVEMQDEPPDQLEAATEVDEKGCVLELPRLSHTGVSAAQRENRRLMVGRHVITWVPRVQSSFLFWWARSPLSIRRP